MTPFNSCQKANLFFTYCLGICISVFAQPVVKWDKSYGGTNEDWGKSIIQTTDGGYIMAGTTASADGHVLTSTDPDGSGFHIAAKTTDFWVVKLDKNGNVEWQNALGGTATESMGGIIQDDDGNYVVAGSTSSTDGDLLLPDADGNGFHADPVNGTGDFWVVKLNATGHIIWQNALGGTSADEARAIVQAKDGNYVIVGNTCSNDGDVSGFHGSTDVWVVKLNKNGQLIWQNAFGGGSSGNMTGGDLEWGNAVSAFPDSGVVIAGWTFGAYSTDVGDVSPATDPDGSGFHLMTWWNPAWGGVPNPCNDGWVFKLDKNGNLVWQNAIGGTYDEWINDIVALEDGSSVLAGYTSSNDGDVHTSTDPDGSGNHGQYDFWVVKLNSQGQMVWQNSLGATQSEKANSVFPACNGGFIVTGDSRTIYANGDKTQQNPNLMRGACWMVRIDSEGKKVFDKTIGSGVPNTGDGTSLENFSDAIFDSYGNYMALSYSYASPGFDKTSNNIGKTDTWLLQLADAAGSFTPDTVCSNAPALFATTTPGLYNPSTYNWTFGNPESGNANTSTLVTPIHTYSATGTYIVTLIVEKDCVTDTITQNVVVINSSACSSTTTNIEKSEQNKTLHIYPNPATSILYISAATENIPVIVTITNTVGIEVYKKNIDNRANIINEEIDLLTYANGMYFINLLSEKQNVSQKIIKQ